MFVHEMTEAECLDALTRTNVGHLACARGSQPYVVPLNFAFDGRFIYGFTTLGQKVEWMRANPLVCFEVTEVIDHNHWTSVIAFGKYEELLDRPEYEEARNRAYGFLQQRPMWWEPAYISQEHQDQPHSLAPIFFRIHVDSMTGYHATPGPCECDRQTESAAAKDSATGFAQKVDQRLAVKPLFVQSLPATKSSTVKEPASRSRLARIWLRPHVELHWNTRAIGEL